MLISRMCATLCSLFTRSSFVPVASVMAHESRLFLTHWQLVAISDARGASPLSLF